MKPIKLELKNFGPFINETIHFDELKKEQLFLISGRTGSGKTILFDAMTYALYGEASTKDRDKNALRSQFADENEVSSVTFTFTINNATYIAERQLPYKKPGNKNMTDTKFQLHEITDDKKLLAAKPAEGKQAVQNIMKVDANQFRQILILPQGEFKRFLVSSSKEKQPVLRTLFGTDRFKSLEDKLMTETKALEASVHSMEERLYLLLEQVKTEKRFDGTISQQFASYMDEVKRQQHALEDVQVRLSRKLEELSLERQSLEQAIQVNDWQRQIKEAEARQAELIESDAAIQNAKDEVSQLLVLDYLKEKKEALDNLKDKRTVWQNDFNTLKDKQKHEDHQLSILKESMTALDQEYDSIEEKKHFRDNHRHYIVEEEWHRLEEKITESINELQAHRQKLEQLEPVDTGKLLNELNEIMTEREQLSQQLQVKQITITQLENERRDSDKQNEQANIRSTYEEELQELNQKKTEPLLDAVVKLRQHLHTGDHCPVCMQQISVVPDIPDRETLEEHQKIEHRKIKLESLIEQLQHYQIRDTTEVVKQLKTLNVELSELTAKKERSDSHYASLSERYQKELNNQSIYQSQQQLYENLQRDLRMSEQLYEQFKKRTGYQTYQQFEEAWQQCHQSIQDHEENVNDLKSQILDKERLLTKVESELSHLTVILSDSEAEYESLALKLQSDLAKNKLTEDSIEQNVDISRLETLQQKIEDYQTAVQEVQFKLDTLNQNMAGRTSTDIQPIEESIKNLENAVNMLEAEKHTLLIRVGDNEELLKQIDALLTEYEAKIAKQKEALELSRLINGKNPLNLTLENYVLTYYLEQTLILSNLRLNEMTHHRYQFRRKKEKSLGYSGLDIEIFDLYSNQVRDISTLSGGETFLASLALALGLSDYVTQLSGGISLESVFIDEGFGTLDNETLETAIESLIELERSGKMVGLISHVEMLKSRIPAILHVESTGYLSSTRFSIK
ncbi:SbcC/MukB-like Walker B domain-containing protein [Macrococcus brunensis]|uniref:SbcC/MukB-like Walker B domain-containing protein n=1 Tax=Macrococcus brunensis TaxID=198483 RepID=UPI001EF0466C|nr:SMC family ATPase [Macrococcus brunensis]ULG70928.1 SMC family ATPase [Macrococcus brunensis]